MKLVEEFKASDEPIYQIAYDEKNEILYTCSDNTIKVWRTDNNKKWMLEATLLKHEKHLRKLAFVEGKLYSADENGEVKLHYILQCIQTIGKSKCLKLSMSTHLGFTIWSICFRAFYLIEH